MYMYYSCNYFLSSAKHVIKMRQTAVNSYTKVMYMITWAGVPGELCTQICTGHNFRENECPGMKNTLRNKTLDVNWDMVLGFTVYYSIITFKKDNR